MAEYLVECLGNQKVATMVARLVSQRALKLVAAMAENLV
jgi:hypothetical protein